jgi:SAM-dependent methyltransferase
MMQRVCPVSGSSNWVSVFESETGRIITGDQRICSGNLEKVICPESGVISNKNRFSDYDIEILYGEEYELNVLGKEEHFFYTESGPKARSEVFFDWIQPHLPESFSSLIEIGCGEGNLLSRISEKFPEKSVSGIDGSFKAVKLAEAKGLNVQRKLILGTGGFAPGRHISYLLGVMEHVEDIRILFYATNLKQSLACKWKNNILSMPVQDYLAVMISSFAEHVWHFTSRQFESSFLE